MKIMIVEDQKLVLQGIRKMFSHFSQDDFFCFDDSDKALRALTVIRPDAIFSDIVMQNVDGLKLIEEASKLLPNCRYVILSGYADFEYARRAISLNVDVYLVKPVARAALEDAWRKVGGGSEEAQRQKTQTQRLSEMALHYITGHADQPLTIGEVANAIHVSPNYLSNVFRRETGITITESIRSEQMMAAHRMLSETNMYLYEIAGQLGYRDVKYFSVLFKEYFGVTPKAYRRSLDMECENDEQDTELE